MPGVFRIPAQPGHSITDAVKLPRLQEKRWALDTEDGLRERKRRQTRAAIAQAAMQLFTEHGFDQVSVAQIAAAAGVAE